MLLFLFKSELPKMKLENNHQFILIGIDLWQVSESESESRLDQIRQKTLSFAWNLVCDLGHLTNFLATNVSRRFPEDSSILLPVPVQ